MKKHDIFKDYQKFLKDNPDLKKILEQLQIDEETYINSLTSINPNIIVPKTTVSNKSYNF